MSVNDVHNLFISIGIPDDWKVKIMNDSFLYLESESESLIIRVFKPSFSDNWVLQLDNDRIDLVDIDIIKIIIDNYNEYLIMKNDLNKKMSYIRKLFNKESGVIRDIKINKLLK